MRKFFTVVSVLGFLIIFGALGGSDLEVFSGIPTLTDKQFFCQIAFGFIMFIGGYFGSVVTKGFSKPKSLPFYTYKKVS